MMFGERMWSLNMRDLHKKELLFLSRSSVVRWIWFTLSVRVQRAPVCTLEEGAGC